MKLPLHFPAPRGVDCAVPVLFSAWIRAPLNLSAGDEIEIDLPAELLCHTETESTPRTIRASGRIAGVAVHADGRLWYEFAADAASEIPLLSSETIPQYLALSIFP